MEAKRDTWDYILLLKMAIQACKLLAKMQTTLPTYISILQKCNSLTYLAFMELLAPFSRLLPPFETDQKMKEIGSKLYHHHFYEETR